VSPSLCFMKSRKLVSPMNATSRSTIRAHFRPKIPMLERMGHDSKGISGRIGPASPVSLPAVKIMFTDSWYFAR
jgi:hypothetical protein